MAHPPSSPLRELRIPRRREETPISLLPLRHHRGSILLPLLPTTLPLPLHLLPMRILSLLPIIHHKRQRSRQADNDQALDNTLVDLVVVIVIAARHAVGEGIVGGVIIIGVTVVVGVLVFEEGGEPVA